MQAQHISLNSDTWDSAISNYNALLSEQFSIHRLLTKCQKFLLKTVLVTPISGVREWRGPDASAIPSETIHHSGNLDLNCHFFSLTWITAYSSLLAAVKTGQQSLETGTQHLKSQAALVKACNTIGSTPYVCLQKQSNLLLLLIYNLLLQKGIAILKKRK